MVTALFVIGIIIIFGSIIAGVLAGSFGGFITIVSGGLISAIIFFALSRIINNQYIIINNIETLKENDRKSRKIKKRTCINCNKEFDLDMHSCPYCGYHY